MVCSMNEVTIQWARLVLGWVTHLQADTLPQNVNKPTKSTQPCIIPGSLNHVPALIGWGLGWNVTSAGWQLTLYDPM